MSNNSNDSDSSDSAFNIGKALEQIELRKQKQNGDSSSSSSHRSSLSSQAGSRSQDDDGSVDGEERQQEAQTQQEGKSEDEDDGSVDGEKHQQEAEDAESDDGTPPAWTNSKARDYLYGCLIRKEIPGRDQIKPKQVFETYCKHRPEFRHFQDYKALDFATKLRSLRDKVEERQDRSSEDAEALAHDRLIFPPREEDTKGRPIWAGSEAQKLLRKDIQDNKHKQMKPKVLYEFRDQYHDGFDLDFFRNKIYQEVKALKRVAWMKEKAEKKNNNKKKKKKK